MRARAFWQIGAVVIVLGILAASWFLAISPKLQESTDNDALRAETEAQNANLELDIANLSAIDVADLEQRLTAFADSIPPVPELTDYVRDAWSRTTASGARLIAIDFSPAEVFAPSVAGSTGAAPDPAAADAVGAPLPIAQEDLVAATEVGLILVKFSLTVAGTYDSIVAAAQSFQAHAPRSTLVTDIAVTESPEDPSNSTGMIVGTVWVLPLTPPAAPGQTPAG